MNSPILSLINVAAGYGKQKILRSINFEIREQEILFLTGPSGAGKTTLLNVISGEKEVSSGKIIRNKKDLFISRIFQDQRFFPSLSLKQNLEMSYDPRIYNNKSDFEKHLENLISFWGMKGQLDIKMKNANGGLKQQVLATRALLTLPNLLLADEPTSFMDATVSARLFELLTHYNKKYGMTVIWSSHNRELVRKFSGRNIHIDKGVQVYTGHACFI